MKVKKVKKTRKISFASFTTFVFVFAVIMFLLSFTIIKGQNVLLLKQITLQENENAVLTNEVEELEVEVKELDNRERILSIAEEQGLSVDQSSIVSVVSDASDTDEE